MFPRERKVRGFDLAFLLELPLGPAVCSQLSSHLLKGHRILSTILMNYAEFAARCAWMYQQFGFDFFSLQLHILGTFGITINMLSFSPFTRQQ